MFAIQRQMIEIRTYAAGFARLVAAGNATKRAHSASLRLTLSAEIRFRGHDENAPDN